MLNFFGKTFDFFLKSLDFSKMQLCNEIIWFQKSICFQFFKILRKKNLQTYTKRPGEPLQNCLLLYERVTSTTPGIWRGGVCTRMACEVINSLHTNIVPKTTWSPSKKLSPTIMTVAPPVVQPSLGEIALMQGVATGRGGYRPVIVRIREIG